MSAQHVNPGEWDAKTPSASADPFSSVFGTGRSTGRAIRELDNDDQAAVRAFAHHQAAAGGRLRAHPYLQFADGRYSRLELDGQLVALAERKHVNPAERASYTKPAVYHILDAAFEAISQTLARVSPRWPGEAAPQSLRASAAELRQLLKSAESEQLRRSLNRRAP